jgi:hypothetical protein
MDLQSRRNRGIKRPSQVGGDQRGTGKSQSDKKYEAEHDTNAIHHSEVTGNRQYYTAGGGISSCIAFRPIRLSVWRDVGSTPCKLRN